MANIQKARTVSALKSGRSENRQASLGTYSHNALKAQESLELFTVPLSPPHTTHTFWRRTVSTCDKGGAVVTPALADGASHPGQVPV